MKHNEPSIAPKAHTKKHILALLLACGAASSQCHGNPVAIAAVVVDGLGLGVDLAIKAGTAFYGTEESTVSVRLSEYYYQSTTEYPSPEVNTRRWHVFKDYDGKYAYVYTELKNGAVVSVSMEPFALGTTQGLPLMKRNYYCKTITPTRTTIVSSLATMEHRVSHKVDKRGGYFYTPPKQIPVNLNLNLTKWPGTCADKFVPGISRTASVSVPHNGSVLWKYEYENYEVADGTIEAR